jgi:iron-sulfur cluster assembly protein
VRQVHISISMAILTVLPLGEGEILLERLLQDGVPLAHDCGGTLACASCRIIVREGLESLSPASEDERDMLDKASCSEPGSRLACQTIGSSGGLAIEIPNYLPPAVGLQGPCREITLSAAAARHFAAQLAQRPGSVAVRISVRPAGCSGYRYDVDHAEAIGAQDTVFESKGIRILVDPAALPFVQGTTLDVVQEGLSRRLRFDNPNATRTCGCGASFGA